MPLRNLLPDGLRHFRLHGSSRTRINRCDPLHCAALKEERKADRNRQALPLDIVDLEVSKVKRVSRNSPVSHACRTLKEKGASIARANNPPLPWIDRVWMFGS